MALSDVFHNAVNVLFTVFVSLVKPGKYIVTPIEDGWDDSAISEEYDFETIVNGLSQKDLQNTKFFAQMEPTDTVVMIKGSVVIEKRIRVRNSDSFSIQHTTYTQLYSIVAHETDPAEALYLLLLREK